jgi:hypothetical protein
MDDRQGIEGDGGRGADLANEFAHVRVRRIATRNGVRLEIEAPRMNRRVTLCPLELESLTWQTPDTFSEFLATPFGPENELE